MSFQASGWRKGSVLGKAKALSHQPHCEAMVCDQCTLLVLHISGPKTEDLQQFCGTHSMGHPMWLPPGWSVPSLPVSLLGRHKWEGKVHQSNSHGFQATHTGVLVANVCLACKFSHGASHLWLMFRILTWTMNGGQLLALHLSGPWEVCKRNSVGLQCPSWSPSSRAVSHQGVSTILWISERKSFPWHGTVGYPCRKKGLKLLPCIASSLGPFHSGIFESLERPAGRLHGCGQPWGNSRSLYEIGALLTCKHKKHQTKSVGQQNPLKEHNSNFISSHEKWLSHLYPGESD